MCESEYNVKMRFKVTNVAGDSAYTEFIGHEVTKDFLRAMVKRRTSRIDSHILATTKDDKKIRVTSTCFTINRAEVRQAKAIRQTITNYILARAAEVSYNDFIKEIVNGEASRELFKTVKLIFPTRRVEIIKSKAVPVQ